MNFFTNAGIVISVSGSLLLIMAIIIELFKKSPILIEPFEVPEELVKSGLNEKVLANKLLDQINNIKNNAEIKLKNEDFIPSWSSINAELPGSKLSPRSVAFYIKKLVGKRQITVQSEIIKINGDISITSRVYGKPEKTIKGTIDGLNDLLQNIAYHIVEHTNPNVLVRYQFNIDKEKSIRLIQQVITDNKDTKNAESLFLLGVIMIEKKQYAESIEVFQRVIQLEPQHLGAHGNWGNALRNIGQIEEAIEKYKKVIEIDPKDAKAYTNWGVSFNELNRKSEAIEKYKKAIEIDSKYTNAFYNWGITLGTLGKHEEAIEKFARAVEIDPNHTNAFYNWGITLGILGKHEEAIEKFSKSIEIKPKNAIVYLGWGVALGKLGKLNEAIEKFVKAVDIDPMNSSAYYNWGNALNELCKYEEAIEMYKRTVDKDSNHAMAYFGWGVALDQLEKYEEAIEKYELTVKNDPDGEAGIIAKKRLEKLKIIIEKKSK